jgi:hypothetical protein
MLVPAPARLVVFAFLVGPLISVLFLEAFFRSFPSLLPLPSEQKEIAWRTAHRASNERVQNSQRTFDRFSPELGWELRPNLRTPGLNSNSKGIRGTREYSLNRLPGTRRILALGDSFMFGENLIDTETFSARLENYLQPDGAWEVLNLGVHGYGLDQEWLRLQRFGFQYRADLVLMGIYEDDILRTTLKFRDYAKPYFELGEGRLVLRNSPVPSPEQILARPMQFDACRVRIGCLTQTAFEKIQRALPGISLERTRAGAVSIRILDAARLATLDRGMRLMVMIIPYQKFDQAPSKEELLVSRWAKRTGTPFVNLREAYLQLPANERQKLYVGHWTPYGAAVTASLVAPRVTAAVSGGGL